MVVSLLLFICNTTGCINFKNVCIKIFGGIEGAFDPIIHIRLFIPKNRGFCQHSFYKFWLIVMPLKTQCNGRKLQCLVNIWTRIQ